MRTLHQFTTIGYSIVLLFACASEESPRDEKDTTSIEIAETSEAETTALKIVDRTDITQRRVDGKVQKVAPDQDHPRARFFAKEAFASSWDGRLYWNPVPIAKDTKRNLFVYKHEVRFFRAENLTKRNERVVTQDPNLMSPPKIIHHGFCPDPNACQIFRDAELARRPKAKSQKNRW